MRFLVVLSIMMGIRLLLARRTTRVGYGNANKVTNRMTRVNRVNRVNRVIALVGLVGF